MMRQDTKHTGMSAECLIAPDNYNRTPIDNISYNDRLITDQLMKHAHPLDQMGIHDVNLEDRNARFSVQARRQQCEGQLFDCVRYVVERPDGYHKDPTHVQAIIDRWNMAYKSVLSLSARPTEGEIKKRLDNLERAKRAIENRKIAPKEYSQAAEINAHLQALGMEHTALKVYQGENGIPVEFSETGLSTMPGSNTFECIEDVPAELLIAEVKLRAVAAQIASVEDVEAINACVDFLVDKLDYTATMNRALTIVLSLRTPTDSDAALNAFRSAGDIIGENTIGPAGGKEGWLTKTHTRLHRHLQRTIKEEDLRDDPREALIGVLNSARRAAPAEPILPDWRAAPGESTLPESSATTRPGRQLLLALKENAVWLWVFGFIGLVGYPLIFSILDKLAGYESGLHDYLRGYALGHSDIFRHVPLLGDGLARNLMANGLAETVGRVHGTLKTRFPTAHTTHFAKALLIPAATWQAYENFQLFVFGIGMLLPYEWSDGIGLRIRMLCAGLGFLAAIGFSARHFISRRTRSSLSFR